MNSLDDAPARERLAAVLEEIRACRICRDAPRGAPLPHEPRPVLRVSTTAPPMSVQPGAGHARACVGNAVHRSVRRSLREWMGVTPEEFYDPGRLAIVPMGFCFPGLDAKGGDLPPRRECAPAWHEQLFAALPAIRAGAAGRSICAALASGSAGAAEPHRYRRRLAVVCRRGRSRQIPAYAAPVLAQQSLAEAPSLVRRGAAALPARRR